jgi:hypothetical protein
LIYMVMSGRIDNMTEEKDSVTTKKINEPKKTVAKKAAPKKNITEDTITSNETVLVVFESGAGYSTGSGIRFSQKRKMAEVSLEEARQLLSLENFRLPNDEEKEMYYNNRED